MFAFGSGLMWGTALQDASGATIAQPTPINFGTMQSSEIEFKFELKELFGDKQFAVAVGRSKGTVTGKASFADLRMGMLESLVFGTTTATGLIAVQYDTVGANFAASVTVTPPSSGTYDADLGVINAATGVPLKRVAASPALGEYSVNTSTGAYTFNAGQTGKGYFNYRYTSTSPTTAKKLTLTNLPMGYAPSFRTDLYVAYGGKSYVMTLNKCISEGIKLGNKNDDFSTPDLSFKCFADDAGIIGTLSLWE